MKRAMLMKLARIAAIAVAACVGLYLALLYGEIP
jgi:hypothetical protein